MTEEHENIELRSGEVQEILGTPPRWIIRWGTLLIFLLLAVMVGIGYMVKYPDIVHAPLSITTNIPPVKVIAKNSGYIANLMVEENQSIKKADLILVMKTTAKYSDIELVTQEVDSLIAQDPTLNQLNAYKAPYPVLLGEAQAAYDAFYKGLKNLNVKRQKVADEAKEKDIQKRIGKVRSSIKKLEKQKATSEQAKKIADDAFRIQKELYSKKATTISELQSSKQEIFKAEQNIENIKLKIDEKEDEIAQFEASIKALKEANVFTGEDKVVEIKSLMTQVKSELLLWKEKNLLYADVDGTVTFFGEIGQTNKFVKTGDEIMAIIPAAQTGILGQAAIPIIGSGKVKEGQRVVVKLDSYPHEEFGYVEGIVVEKASLPKDGTYTVKVNMPTGLKTSHDKVIDFQQEMLGTAEIITEDRRFLNRIFDKLISMVKNR